MSPEELRKMAEDWQKQNVDVKVDGVRDAYYCPRMLGIIAERQVIFARELADLKERVEKTP